jgi:hypothetical protein
MFNIVAGKTVFSPFFCYASGMGGAAKQITIAATAIALRLQQIADPLGPMQCNMPLMGPYLREPNTAKLGQQRNREGLGTPQWPH